MEHQLVHIFRKALLSWHLNNPRELPWKETDDPYKIWLSEIILQQTQVVQGIPYYRHFVNKYPTVVHLASATEDQILNDWQGLGYNSRARNLHRAAITVTNDNGGEFPKTYEGLLELPGVGNYTAAAVASFAYGEQVPVIDANVIRVLCRFLGIQSLASSSATLKQMRSFLEKAIASTDPAQFNQGIMNFGAVVCKPKKPTCQSCPLQNECYAYNHDLVHVLPAKKKRAPRRERYFHYLVITTNDGVYLRKRIGKGIWEGMFDFPLVENDSSDKLDQESVENWLNQFTNITGKVTFDVVSEVQILTHQRISCNFYTCSVENVQFKASDNEISFAAFENLHTFAVPKVVDCYFKAKSIFL